MMFENYVVVFAILNCLIWKVESQCQSALGCDADDYQGCMSKTQSCTDIKCRGYQGCYDGTQSYSLTSTSGDIKVYGFRAADGMAGIYGAAAVDCKGYFSCSYVDDIISYSNHIICSGDSSCYAASLIETSLLGGYIYCSGESSCELVNNIITNNSSNGNIFCYGHRSCQNSSNIISGRFLYCHGKSSCYSVSKLYSQFAVTCAGEKSCYGANLIESGSLSIDCTGEKSCAYVNKMITNLNLKCDSRYSCYYSNIITVYSAVYCRGYESCTNINQLNVITGDVECTGEYSCKNTSMNIDISLRNESLRNTNIYCSNSYSCANTTITYNVSSVALQQNNQYRNSLSGYGKMAFAEAIITDNSESDVMLYGYGISSFYQTTMNKNSVNGTSYLYGKCQLSFESSVITLNDKKSNIYLHSNQASYNGVFNINSNLSSNIQAYGYYSAQLATFNVETPIANFEFYGYNAGYDATINCGESSLCNIDCFGNGCNRLTLVCNGTCVVSCDESDNIDCPHGYVGPTTTPSNLPTANPSINPTADPSGNPTNNPTNNPSNKPSNNPSENPTVDPTSIPTYIPTNNPSDMPSINPSNDPSAYPSTEPTGGINATVICDETEQCMNASSLYGDSIECLGLRSCQNVDTIESNSDLLCSGTESCKDVRITYVTNVYGYGSKSLENALIYLSINSTSAYFYGYESGNGANIICGNNSICNIYCKGDSCKNTTLVCNGQCNIDCDESKDINCPLGDGAIPPTGSPTGLPTTGLPTSSAMKYYTSSLESDANGNNNNVETFVDNIGTNGVFAIIVLFLGLLLCLICVCFWLIMTNKFGHKDNDINNNNNNNNDEGKNDNNRMMVRDISTMNAILDRNTGGQERDNNLDDVFADLEQASNENGNINCNIDGDKDEELYGYDDEEGGDVIGHIHVKTTTITGEIGGAVADDVDDAYDDVYDDDASVIINNNNDVNGVMLIDELNYKEWSQKDVLLWIKSQLLTNGIEKTLILNFLKELSNKNVTGSVITQFKSNPKLFNAFTLQFSKENQNVSIWLIISLSIQQIGIDTKH